MTLAENLRIFREPIGLVSRSPPDYMTVPEPGGSMTTSRQTEDLNHPAIRDLVNAANALPLGDRVTLLKALIPEVAREMSPREFEAIVVELRLKGERFYDALTHPGQGRESRHVMGERDVERR